MISPNENIESPAKREVENLTDEEAALFLKLVKLYKNSDFASPQVPSETRSDTVSYSEKLMKLDAEDGSNQKALFDQLHALNTEHVKQHPDYTLQEASASANSTNAFTQKTQDMSSITTGGFQAALFITPPKVSQDSGSSGYSGKNSQNASNLGSSATMNTYQLLGTPKSTVVNRNLAASIFSQGPADSNQGFHQAVEDLQGRLSATQFESNCQENRQNQQILPSKVFDSQKQAGTPSNQALPQCIGQELF